MKWWNVIGIYRKGLLYDNLQSSVSILSEQLLSCNNKLLEQQSHTNILQSNYDAVSIAYKKLLQEGKIDLLDAKDWYETKYGNTPYFYNYDGKGAKDIKSALRVTNDGASGFKDAARLLIEKYGLVSSHAPHKVVEAVMDYFSKSSNWTYVFDTSQFKRNDYWELAEKSWRTRRGDCDDLALLMHLLCFYIFEKLGLQDHYWRLKFAVGRLLQYGGHAFNVWLHTDGEWYVVESTYDLRGSFNRTWLHTPARYNNLYEEFWGFARRDKSWSANIKALDKYKDGE